ncbi:Crp/Fnr family transcriptional regulator [Roseovarius sp. 2305UL8-3]|uniref:Crp/Fnr family transcriptional regulator n=1 Tax=Roseovarius conchicola TaxID=3121636 RepID=UPI0035297C80
MKRIENLDMVRTSLLLRSLPDEAVDTLLQDASVRTATRGETIFLQGEPADAIHIVAEGWVKLYRVSPNGNEAVVNVFTRGHSFGEAVAFRMGTYPVSAEAVTDCKLLAVSSRTFINLLKHDPEVAIAVIASTFAHLNQLVGQVEQMKAQTGAQRVADFLLELCDCKTGSCTVTLPYDKALIAGRLGMKPESLSRAFTKLKPIGVGITRNHATIKDVTALMTYAEEDPASAWGKAL